jgi:hypothetical protein
MSLQCKQGGETGRWNVKEHDVISIERDELNPDSLSCQGCTHHLSGFWSMCLCREFL